MTKNERSILVTYYESFSILRYLYSSATLTEKERAIKTVETGMIFPGRGRIVYKQEPIYVNHIKTIHVIDNLLSTNTVTIKRN